MPPTRNKSCTLLFTTLQLNQGVMLFGFKNRTPSLGFYGLVRNAASALPHPVSAPAGPCPAAGSALYKFSESTRRNVGPGRFMGLALAEAVHHGSSHSPAALPQPMQLRLGRSVFCLHPSLLSHPINPLFLDDLGGHPCGGAVPVLPHLSEPPLNS